MNSDEFDERRTPQTIEAMIDRQRKLVPCAKCGKPWRPDLIDTCNCGLANICPECMKSHVCAGGGA